MAQTHGDIHKPPLTNIVDVAKTRRWEMAVRKGLLARRVQPAQAEATGK